MENKNKNFTKEHRSGNMITLFFGGMAIMYQLLVSFEGSPWFKVIGVLATIFTILSFAWHKLLFFDKFVHSLWLKKRLKLDYKCLYGYGVDEFFVLARLCVLTVVLSLLFLVSNAIDYYSGTLVAAIAAVEVGITIVFALVFIFQLAKYDTAFSRVRGKLVAACVFVLGSSIIFCYATDCHNIVYAAAIVALVASLGFYVHCAKELILAGRNLEWGNHAVVELDYIQVDSAKNKFYLTYYSKEKIKITLYRDDIFKTGWVDSVKIIDNRSSDAIDDLENHGRIRSSSFEITDFIEKVLGLKQLKKQPNSLTRQ